MWFDPDNVTPRLRAPRYKPSFPTLRAFIAFARSKPADETYDYPDPGVCACAQFWDRGKFWGVEHHNTVFNEGVSLDEIAISKPWTWGALAKRAQIELAAREAFEHV